MADQEESKGIDIALSQAVEAYRRWELRNLAADRAYKDLNVSVMYLAAIRLSDSPEERMGTLKKYYELTEPIREEFNKKREKEGL